MTWGKMPDDADFVTLADVHARRETDLALQCSIDGKLMWIPKSVVHDDSEVYNAGPNSTGKLVLPLWFALREGLVDE